MATVPAAVAVEGALQVGAVYRRRDIHKRFGGNRQAGIVPCKQERVIFLFHTFEPAQQFYRDGLDEDGIYWYSGEGTAGDMRWTSGNRAVRDHEETGFELWLFERAHRKGGLWRFKQKMRYIGHRHVQARRQTWSHAQDDHVWPSADECAAPSASIPTCSELNWRSTWSLPPSLLQGRRYDESRRTRRDRRASNLFREVVTESVDSDQIAGQIRKIWKALTVRIDAFWAAFSSFSCDGTARLRSGGCSSAPASRGNDFTGSTTAWMKPFLFAVVAHRLGALLHLSAVAAVTSVRGAE